MPQNLFKSILVSFFATSVLTIHIPSEARVAGNLMTLLLKTVKKMAKGPDKEVLEGVLSDPKRAPNLIAKLQSDESSMRGPTYYLTHQRNIAAAAHAVGKIVFIHDPTSADNNLKLQTERVFENFLTRLTIEALDKAVKDLPLEISTPEQYLTYNLSKVVGEAERQIGKKYEHLGEISYKAEIGSDQIRATFSKVDNTVLKRVQTVSTDRNLTDIFGLAATYALSQDFKEE